MTASQMALHGEERVEGAMSMTLQFVSRQDGKRDSRDLLSMRVITHSSLEDWTRYDWALEIRPANMSAMERTKISRRSYAFCGHGGFPKAVDYA